ncbi:hypothetical protein COLO4_05624 [Corchorus olitorius]|uniref:RRM domain-containing protein n=1 Tax=Corchorus olitorius TaxID=93759 RepID=A0A1R3KQD8_9ROSI|nr:hypothetical protein COLO4_05624 [Corchorus olitorius]
MRSVREYFGDRAKSSSSVDWRSSLFSVFVTKLSHKVSRNLLWDVFSDYGRIADVLIQHRGKQKGPTTFAFVRYWNEREAVTAMEKADYKFLEGVRIRVFKARVSNRYGLAARNKDRESIRGEGNRDKFNDAKIYGRSYKDVVANANSGDGDGHSGVAKAVYE